MRLAVISDIHGNWEAFEAVLRDIEDRGAEGILCLGDALGYGADPELVVTEMRRRNIPSILGNHELALLDPSLLEWFNPPTQQSLFITRRLISDSTMHYIGSLKATMVVQGALLVHGAPPDSVLTYLFELGKEKLRSILRDLKQDICFVGHTHQLEIIAWDGRDVSFSPLGPGEHALRTGWKYIINVGSVGQPRDGDNRAKYIIWDPDTWKLEVRFVPYDIAKAALKIIEKGFPAFNAARLW